MYNRYRGNSGKPERVEEKLPPVPVRKSPPTPPENQRRLPALPLSIAALETEDLLLILILYLMYRESGDKELLLILGAMYLL